jgi:hypothetical protein
MRSLDLDRRPDGRVTIDLCSDCQALWFDAFESAQLTPGATLELFRVIHTTAPATRRAMPTDLPCPRCETSLALTHDLQHATRFSYYRCRYGHGRFTPFFQFLREKNFVRPLDPAELARLKESIRTVRSRAAARRSTSQAPRSAPIVRRRSWRSIPTPWKRRCASSTRASESERFPIPTRSAIRSLRWRVFRAKWSASANASAPIS